ncbi:MAG: VWA domain-containing protein [Syntrophobacteria bacterium]
MSYRPRAAAVLVTCCILACACADTSSRSRGVYMFMDTSGTYRDELNRAGSVINYLLGTLRPGDSLAVARIDSGSFSDKDIIARTTFDRRPSVANQQKRLFKKKVDQFISTAKSSAHTNISGGLLQAVEYLAETAAGKKYILIFSDLKQDLIKGHIRDFPIRLRGCHVIALNVTKLPTDNVDPREYLNRLEEWKDRVESGGGYWRVINDLGRLDTIFSS